MQGFVDESITMSSSARMESAFVRLGSRERVYSCRIWYVLHESFATIRNLAFSPSDRSGHPSSNVIIFDFRDGDIIDGVTF